MVKKLKTLFPDKKLCFTTGVTSATENQRTFQIICDACIRKTVVRVRIDACLITDSSVKKCDWLFIIPETKGLVFVECKGNDVLVAIEQLRSTQDLMPTIVNSSVHRLALIIPTKVAPQINSTIQKEMKRFQRDYRISLHVKNRVCRLRLPEYEIF